MRNFVTYKNHMNNRVENLPILQKNEHEIFSNIVPVIAVKVYSVIFDWKIDDDSVKSWQIFHRYDKYISPNLNFQM